MLICDEESISILLNSFAHLFLSAFKLKAQEESVVGAKPHHPLTAMTKASPEAPAPPQEPASAPRAGREPAAKSVELPAKSGE